MRPRHLLLTMEPGSEDEAEIEAWLTEEGDRTRLVVEERGLALDSLYFHGAGWQAHLEDLGRLLSGDSSDWRARRPVSPTRGDALTPTGHEYGYHWSQSAST